MKNKRILALFLSLVFLLGSFPHILAVDALQTEKNDMEDIHAIAQHAPTFFVSTKDWTNTNVIKTTPLYDLEDRVVAYCIDIENADTNENAYVIVSHDKTEAPILQYAPYATSPYFDIPASSRALYVMAGAYHVIEGNYIVDLSTEQAYDRVTVVNAYRESFANTLWTSSTSAQETDFAALREMYVSGVQPKGYDTREKILTGVPNWHWAYGCVPTAIGMQLAKLYPSLNTTNTIAELATLLETDTATGLTHYRYAPQRIPAYITSKGLEAPSYCTFPVVDSNGNPVLGLANNPYSTYLTEINAGRAVAIASYNATSVSTTGYPDGWKAHMITGVGYSYMTSSSERYVIAHTTASYDGRVYININHLGNFSWFIVRD